MPLSQELLIQRLSFIRFLYESAVQQSRQTGLRQTTSILTFHDAVEMFLSLALEHNNIRNRNFTFNDYWSELRKTGTTVTQEASMDRLNRVRVALKHHGVMPSPAAVEEARVNVSNFFRENTQPIFGIDFETVSLTGVVQHTEARRHLVAAEGLMDSTNPNYDEAAGEIAIALQILLDDYQRETDAPHDTFMFGRSPFRSLDLRSITSRGGVSVSPHAERELERFADAVQESVGALWSQLRILALGLDYRRYLRFRSLTPVVVWQQRTQYGRSEWRHDAPPTLEGCRFCLDFVVDAAIRLQELR